MDKYMYIAHHGIKGQKWGVRRYQNPDGTLTDAGKKRARRRKTAQTVVTGTLMGGYAGAYVSVGAAIAGVMGAAPIALIGGAALGAGSAYVTSKKRENQDLNIQFESSLPTRKLSEKEKADFGITDYINKGGVIPKGASLYRIGTTDSSGKEVFGKRAYFSTNEYDNKKWEAEFVPQLAGKEPKSFKYTAVKDLKIAPASELGKEYIKLKKEYSKSDLSSRQLSNELDYTFGRWGLRGDKAQFKGTAKEMDLAASTLVASSYTKSGKELVSRLMKKGYHGVGDINGIDVSNDPIILFDPSHNVSEASSRRFTKSEINNRIRTSPSRTKDVRATVAETKSSRELLSATLKAASRNTQLTNKELAKRFGISESELNALLYG